MKNFKIWLQAFLITFLGLYLISVIYTQILNRQEVGKGGENVWFVCKTYLHLHYYQCDVMKFIDNQTWDMLAWFIISIPLSSGTFLLLKYKKEIKEGIAKFLYTKIKM